VIEATPMSRRLIPDAAIRMLLDHVAGGMSLAAACEAVGISRDSVYRWMKEGDHELVEAYAHAVQQQVYSRFSKE
jgi:AcrR family transcriptional regulator